MRRTSERQFPDRIAGLEDAVQLARHSYPYRLLASLAGPGAHVLEVGFGEGYGSELLIGSVGAYTGVEVSPDAVEHAAAAYGNGARTFSHYDGATLPFADASFDAVISFQVLEHVRDPRRFLAEMARVSRPGALVLASTPNRLVRLRPGERPWNRWHIEEFSAGELRELAAGSFETVEIHGIVGTDLCEQVERRRIARLRSLAAIDRLGLRYALPAAVTSRIARLAAALRRPDRAAPASIPREEELVWTHDAARREDAVDLLLIARR